MTHCNQLHFDANFFASFVWMFSGVVCCTRLHWVLLAPQCNKKASENHNKQTNYVDAMNKMRKTFNSIWNWHILNCSTRAIYTTQCWAQFPLKLTIMQSCHSVKLVLIADFLLRFKSRHWFVLKSLIGCKKKHSLVWANKKKSASSGSYSHNVKSIVVSLFTGFVYTNTI